MATIRSISARLAGRCEWVLSLTPRSRRLRATIAAMPHPEAERYGAVEQDDAGRLTVVHGRGGRQLTVAEDAWSQTEKTPVVIVCTAK